MVSAVQQNDEEVRLVHVIPVPCNTQRTNHIQHYNKLHSFWYLQHAALKSYTALQQTTLILVCYLATRSTQFIYNSARNYTHFGTCNTQHTIHTDTTLKPRWYKLCHKETTIIQTVSLRNILCHKQATVLQRVPQGNYTHTDCETKKLRQ